MFIAALAHAYAFPPRDYMDPTHPKTSFMKSIRIMFDVRDVVDDVQYAVDDSVGTPTPHLPGFTQFGTLLHVCLTR